MPAELTADPALRARFAILLSIPGIGEATALAMLIEMPEPGAIEHQCAASLAGLAPIARASGGFAIARRGGRAPLRQALYMPALVAVRFNAAMQVQYDALLAAGKPPKVALVAIMRKLIILAKHPDPRRQDLDPKTRLTNTDALARGAALAQAQHRAARDPEQEQGRRGEHDRGHYS